MKITLLTCASKEYWPIMELSATNKLDYCLHAGIQFTMKKHTNIISTKELGKERLLFIQKELKNCDWLWFMGADTLIMNYNIGVGTFLCDWYLMRSPVYTISDLIICEDINGINNDVFFLRNSPQSFLFLLKAIELIEHYDNDQEAMKIAMEVMQPDGLKVDVQHQRQFNSYLYSEYNYPDDGGGSYQTGDFVLHLPGISNNRRIEIMKEYLDKVIK